MDKTQKGEKYKMMLSIKIEKSTLWAYFATTVFLLKTFLSISKIIDYNENIDLVLVIVGTVFFTIHLLQQKYTIKILMISIALLLYTLYNVFVTGNSAILVTVVVCIALLSLNMEKYVQYIFTFELGFMALHTVLACVLSFFGTITITQNIGGISRYDFGTQHPNTFAAIVFNLLIMWLWLNFRKCKNAQIIILLLFTAVIYYFCKTRTSCLDMIVILILVFFRNYGAKFDKIIEKIAKYITPVLSAVMAVFVILYSSGNTVVYAMNILLNARIKLGAYAYQHAGITFFGQNLSDLYTNTVWDEVWQLDAFTFDSVYTYMMINQGIIWLIVIIVLFWKLAKKKDTRTNICIIAWALYGLTEVQGINGYTCFSIFLVTELYRSREKRNSDKGENSISRKASLGDVIERKH